MSTRGAAPVLAFDEVLLAGLARDGGLYVPEVWPEIPSGLVDREGERPYAEIAVEVMWPFVDGVIARSDLETIVEDAYHGFDHPDVVPLRRLSDGLWLAELFHGPTLAFKDLPLQVVGRLFDHVLTRRGEKVTIVGATSGDTGSAAIEACRGRDSIEIFILHPAGRVSEVQRRQMTTVDEPNVHNIAIDGTFDDCQDLVKALFADIDFRDRHHLSAVNSINWARVMAQIPYYVTSAGRVAPSGPVSFTVPTGNFGNVLAGYAALRMGAPVDRLVVASNVNDILTRFFGSGRLQIGVVHPSLSPSMDIQVSSNLERLLFELYGRDGTAIADLMQQFRAEGMVEVDPDRMAALGETFSADSIDDDGTLEVIRRVHEEDGVLIDPHTAVGVGVARRPAGSARPMVCMATAHPAKFPDAIGRATGQRPAPPARLAAVMEREEHLVNLPADVGALRSHIAERLLA